MSHRISLFSEDQPPILESEDLAVSIEGSDESPDPVVQMPPGPEEEEDGPSLRQYLDSVRRYRWLVIGCFLLGALAAYGAWRIIEPDYVAQGAVWVEVSDRESAARGPIRSGQLLTSSSWVELLRSFAVLDSVSLQERLYIRASSPAAEQALTNFRIDDRFRPGAYTLRTDSLGRDYTLRTKDGLLVEQGEVGDSIGLSLGFLWQPTGRLLPRDEELSFSILHPRDASRELRRDLDVRMDRNGNFLQIDLGGKDPEKIASVLNSLLDRFVEVAAELKRGKLEAFVEVLEDQRASVAEELAQAEGELEGFRVQTITLPSDATIPIAPGLEATQDPVFANFFQMRVEEEQLRRDQETLERLIETIPSEGVRVEAFEIIPSVRTSPELVAALDELSGKRVELRALLYTYTEDYQPVRDLQRDIRALENQTIPSLARALVAELDSQHSQVEERISSASSELRSIPTRSIEEARLRRQVAAADALYRELDTRYEESRLELSASLPDVRILDDAAVPQVPANDQRIRMALLLLLGGLGVGLGGAVLLDRADPKVRYPEQVTDLGLDVLGAIPRIRHPNGRRASENAAQVLEAFRELRIGVSYAFGKAGPMVLTISSPGQGEGKSFVATNLAVSFAEMGQKTLLIDGDTRRGDLHHLLERQRKPGLVDGIMERLSRAPSGRGVIQETDYPSLHFISGGTRQSNSPELLGSPAFREILGWVKRRYEVIIVDSPPLGAGGDAFVLAATTGNLLLVMRNGETLRELAAVKMEPLERLPVRILGAVLNDVDPRGIYERYYYSYIPGYEAEGEEGDQARQLIEAGTTT